MTVRDEIETIVEELRSRPGVAIQTTNPHRLMSQMRKAGLAAGLDLACFSSLSPAEIYVFNKKHEAVAGIFARGRARSVSGGLPRPEGNEQSGASTDPRVHTESAAVSSTGPGGPGTPDRDDLISNLDFGVPT